MKIFKNKKISLLESILKEQETTNKYLWALLPSSDRERITENSRVWMLEEMLGKEI